MSADKPLKGSLAPNTTAQQDLTTAGQRRVNLIWEYTQSAIAIMVVLDSLIVVTIMVIQEKNANDFPLFLASLAMLIVGFYFSRTNHAAIGGIGHKPQVEYKGR